MTDETRPEQPPEPSEMEQLRDSVNSLQTIVNRVREAVGTAEPAPVRESYRVRVLEARVSDAEYERDRARERAEAASQTGTRFMVRAERAEAAIERVRRAVQEASTSVTPVRAGRTLAGQLAARVLAALDEPSDPAAAEAPEPAGFEAIDKIIRCEGPTITVLDEEVKIEGVRVEGPAKLTVHAGPRRLNLQYNAFINGGRAELCRDDTCACHAAATQATERDKTTRVFAALHRSAEQDVSRVIALYQQWVKAGPPPLGTPMSRWWDARLVELHDAIVPPTT